MLRFVKLAALISHCYIMISIFDIVPQVKDEA